MSDPVYQYLRECSLLVSNSKGGTLDLSAFRIKFSVKRSGVQTPNVADIYVYNLDVGTAQIIKKEFGKIILQAGYKGNFGVIFKGDVKQCILGRENATDTFVNFIAGDSEQAYNYSIVKTSIAAGSDPNDHFKAAFQSMAANGVSQGFVGQMDTTKKLPRGKVMYGNARDYIRKIADANGFGWSLQDEQIMFVKNTTYAPGTAVVLSIKSGLIGTPMQTVEGITCKCLLNPKLRIHGRVQIDNKSVAEYKLDPFTLGSPANTPSALNVDGFYYILMVEHVGDTRGTEWYSNLVTATIDLSDNPTNSVGIGGSA